MVVKGNERSRFELCNIPPALTRNRIVLHLTPNNHIQNKETTDVKIPTNKHDPQYINGSLFPAQPNHIPRKTSTRNVVMHKLATKMIRIIGTISSFSSYEQRPVDNQMGGAFNCRCAERCTIILLCKPQPGCLEEQRGGGNRGLGGFLDVLQ